MSRDGHLLSNSSYMIVSIGVASLIALNVQGFPDKDSNEACPIGNWGVNCDMTCLDCPTLNCNRTTGICNVSETSIIALNVQGFPDKDYYGACPIGNWGVNCDMTCPDCPTLNCNRTTGICNVSETCPKGYWGLECTKKCPSCPTSTCNRIIGGCDAKKTCPQFTYGENCDQSCSDKCRQTRRCNSVSGSCYHGCEDGYTGLRCNQVDAQCESGTWGVSCKRNCSELCKYSICDPVSGTCLECYVGKELPWCREDCKNGTWGSRCLSQCKCPPEYSCNPADGTCKKLEMPTKDQSAQQTPYLGYLLIIIVCVSITLLSIPLALCITPKYNAKVIKKGEEDREPIPPKSNDSFLVRASIFRISQGLTKPLSVMSTADRTKSEQSLSRNSIQSAKE